MRLGVPCEPTQLQCRQSASVQARWGGFERVKSGEGDGAQAQRGGHCKVTRVGRGWGCAGVDWGRGAIG